MDDEKGFTVNDREKKSDRNDAAGEAGRRRGAPNDAPKHEDFVTGLTFSTLLLSLSTSVLVNLGELPDPISKEKTINLSLAKQTIGIIEVLKDKTAGNLNNDEDRLINNMLYDLRMKYVGMSSTEK
ncbi:MAG: DUF1844 domain-containing protein [Syntrophobacterales bacterium]|jgi:hypothetical protein|nr:DUF1844 domain-containing protein [Syntrophobacterales bacterium]